MRKQAKLASFHLFWGWLAVTSLLHSHFSSMHALAIEGWRQLSVTSWLSMHFLTSYYTNSKIKHLQSRVLPAMPHIKVASFLWHLQASCNFVLNCLISISLGSFNKRSTAMTSNIQHLWHAKNEFSAFQIEDSSIML